MIATSSTLRRGKSRPAVGFGRALSGKRPQYRRILAGAGTGKSFSVGNEYLPWSSRDGVAISTALGVGPILERMDDRESKKILSSRSH